MGFINESNVEIPPFPTMEEIGVMTEEKAKLERTRLRTELSFRISDRGGKDHTKEMNLLRKLIDALSRQIDACMAEKASNGCGDK